MIDDRPDDAELHAAILAVTAPIVASAQRCYGRPLPDMRSRAWIDAPVDVQLAGIVVCGTAWVVEDPRQAERRAVREAGLDIHGDDAQLWRDLARREPRYVTLARRDEAACPVYCTRAGCGVVLTMPVPLRPDVATVLCARCAAAS